MPHDDNDLISQLSESLTRQRYSAVAVHNYCYSQVNLETKRKAFERVETRSRASKAPRWRRDTSLLAWLGSLWEEAEIM
jgi:hypothetical protein